MLDGELVIPAGGTLDFNALQMRLHPAESRIRRLAAETPALFILFDCLAAGGEVLTGKPLSDRRAALEAFYRRAGMNSNLRLSPYTDDRGKALRWLSRASGPIDGVIAKARGAPYEPGERRMIKVKPLRTADCVVGGFRYAQDKPVVGSLLLGLYNDDGELDHVGFTSTMPHAGLPELTRRLAALIAPPGLHRQGARRTQPLEHRPLRRLGASAARAGRRGPLRPCHRAPLPPRHQMDALAARQGAPPMHVRADPQSRGAPRAGQRHARMTRA